MHGLPKKFWVEEARRLNKKAKKYGLPINEKLIAKSVGEIMDEPSEITYTVETYKTT